MQHKDLSGGRWRRLSLVEQMANIGSEVERAIQWKAKNNIPYASQANVRALELFDLTLADSRHGAGRREIARARELWLDYFIGDNQYHQQASEWQRYFYFFAFAARNRCETA
ncbi:MAG TPA: hypothetical protein VMR81_04095 [Patescibacteria group bacterium]|nr:hypothetical protein [Patescibacteria group bacterium]